VGDPLPASLSRALHSSCCLCNVGPICQWRTVGRSRSHGLRPPPREPSPSMATTFRDLLHARLSTHKSSRAALLETLSFPCYSLARAHLPETQITAACAVQDSEDRRRRPRVPPIATPGPDWRWGTIGVGVRHLLDSLWWRNMTPSRGIGSPSSKVVAYLHLPGASDFRPMISGTNLSPVYTLIRGSLCAIRNL
jgi:hypothetical protein